MAILLNRSTRVIVQGFTGKIGSFHADELGAVALHVLGVE
ncbi:MAG: succinate--CoA ligase subunit alpha, partial [Mesorhizobium sp.]